MSQRAANILWMSIPNSPSRSPDVIRYSPLPQEAYRRMPLHGYTGLASSILLDTPELWNLTYLSHDFERCPDHSDPDFAVMVRRSVQVKLDGSGPDLTLLEGPGIVASLLRLPAPRFVALIRRHAVLNDLPLYRRYGPAWLNTIDRRSHLCCGPDTAEEEDGNVLSGFEQLAKQVLARYQVARGT
jgi:hypothetical protein